MAKIEDELDASLDFGSGYICVVGPPSSGKTTIVLNYLTLREDSFYHRSAFPSCLGPALVSDIDSAERRQPCFCVEYVSACSLCGDTLSRFSRRLMLKPTRRRFEYDCSPFQFGYIVTQWLEAHAAGSELHLVLDDADFLQEGPDYIDTWLSSCLHAATASGSLVCLWLISQMPLRIPSCFRYHFVPLPRVETVCAWLQEQFSRTGPFFWYGMDDEEHDDGGSSSHMDVCNHSKEKQLLSAEDTHRFIMQAVRYYMTHQPMCASAVCRDVRTLLTRVYHLLPVLVAATGNDASKLNAVHFAAAWGHFRESVNTTCEDARRGVGGVCQLSTAIHPETALRRTDPLVLALKRISYSAVLLAFAAFYCGSIPKSKQMQMFSEESDRVHRGRKTSTETHAQSHKAAVLSASVHVVTLSRLLFIYDAMLRMCLQHIDSAELVSAAVAAHYTHVLVAWGLLTPVALHKTDKFHCWIPVSTALQLGHMLSLNLFDLIPA